jgi:hypothetical protein
LNSLVMLFVSVPVPVLCLYSIPVSVLYVLATVETALSTEEVIAIFSGRPAAS